ncbi:MAG: phage tail tape measure protein [Pseudomonadota bacterium]
MTEDEDLALSESAIQAEEIAQTLTISAHTFSRVLRTGLKNAVVEGHSLEKVLRSAAMSISSSALRAGLSPLTSLIGRGASSLFGGLSGTSGQTGGGSGLVPFAKGGVIGTPTAFAAGGGRIGLMGEAGREAILPLARGSDGRLGVAMEGAGGGATITVNVSTPDADSFQRSEAQVTAMLARAVARGRRGL